MEDAGKKTIREEEEDLKGIPAILSCFLSTYVTTLMVLIAVVIIAIRIMGWGLYSVDSYSMSPTYPINSMIVVQKVDPSEIKVNDVITFVINDSGTLVTHRVTAVDTANQTFTTKGDANSTEDASPVLWGNVVGRVVVGVPMVGTCLRYLSSEDNRQTVIAAIVLLLVVSYGWDIVVAVHKKRKKAAQQAAEETSFDMMQEEQTLSEGIVAEEANRDVPQ